MLDVMRSCRIPLPAMLSWITGLGFDTLLLALPRHHGTADIAGFPPSEIADFSPIVEAASRAGLHVQLDLRLDIAGDAASAVRRHPEWYHPITRRPADPRQQPAPPGLHRVNLQAQGAHEAFAEYWAEILRQLNKHGVGSYRCKLHATVPPEVWRNLKAASPELCFSAWTPGLPAADVLSLPRDCFDVTYNSLAWWDFGAGWLKDEWARLAAVAPVANTIGLPDRSTTGPAARQAARRMLDVAAVNGHGLLLATGFEFGLPTGLTYPSYGADDWQRLR